MTSLRWPPVSAPHPKDLHSLALLTKARESEPVTSTVKGAPGLETFVRLGTSTFLMWWNSKSRYKKPPSPTMTTSSTTIPAAIRARLVHRLRLEGRAGGHALSVPGFACRRSCRRLCCGLLHGGLARRRR